MKLRPEAFVCLFCATAIGYLLGSALIGFLIGLVFFLYWRD